MRRREGEEVNEGERVEEASQVNRRGEQGLGGESELDVLEERKHLLLSLKPEKGKR